MTTNTTTCPFCNAVVPLPETPPASGRLVCPRCNDFIQLKDAGAMSAGLAASKLDDEVQRHRDARANRASRSVKLTVVIALSLGVLGLLTGFLINQYRDQPKPPPAAPVLLAGAVPPLEMPALNYLPDGTDSVIAVQLRPFLESLPATEGGSAHNALSRLGISEDLLAGIERVVGMPLENIDQLAFGLKLSGGSLSSQPVLVVMTRQTFSAEEMAKQAKATTERRKDRTYFRTSSSIAFVDRFYWWAPNDHTLVAALKPEVLDAIPTEGRDGRDHLATPVVRNITQLLPEDSYCWAVLDSDSWEALGGLALFAGKPGPAIEQMIEQLINLQTLTLGVRVEGQEPFLTAWIDLKSESSASDLRSWLTRKYKGDGQTITVGGAGNRVMVRTPTSAGGVAAAFQKALPVTRKKK